MRIGLNSFACRWAMGYLDFKPTHPMTAFDFLDRASDLGVDLVQIDSNLPWQSMDAATLQRLRRQAEQRGLVLQFGAIGLRSEHLAWALKVAHQAGGHLLRVHEDRKRWQPSADQIAAQLISVLPLLREYDITVAVENHFWYGAEDIVHIVQAVNDPHVGVSLDTGNCVARLEGWRDTVNRLAPYAVSMHLKDLAAARRGVGFYIAGCPLGEGSIDLRYVIETVRAAGREPDAVPELWMDFAGDEATTLRQEDDWVRRSIEYVRRLLL